MKPEDKEFIDRLYQAFIPEAQEDESRDMKPEDIENMPAGRDYEKLAHIDCDCSTKEICKLFWNLDNFNDYDLQDQPDEYEWLEDEK